MLRGDPVRQGGSPALLTYSRSQYRAAFQSLQVRSLVVHARTQASALDRPFLAHIHGIVHGIDDAADDSSDNSGEKRRRSIFDLQVGQGLGVVREVVGDSHVHLDEAFSSDSSSDASSDASSSGAFPAEEGDREVSMVVCEFLRDAWNDRANTRRQRLRDLEELARVQQAARMRTKRAEAHFNANSASTAQTEPRKDGPLAAISSKL